MFGNWLNLLFVLGSNSYNENETIAKFEIMDGAPVRGKHRSAFYVYMEDLRSLLM